MADFLYDPYIYRWTIDVIGFVYLCLFQLFATITKQGWFDSTKDVFIFRKVIVDVNQFLSVSVFRKVFQSITVWGERSLSLPTARADPFSSERIIARSCRFVKLLAINFFVFKR